MHDILIKYIFDLTSDKREASWLLFLNTLTTWIHTPGYMYLYVIVKLFDQRICIYFQTICIRIAYAPSIIPSPPKASPCIDWPLVQSTYYVWCRYWSIYLGPDLLRHHAPARYAGSVRRVSVSDLVVLLNSSPSLLVVIKFIADPHMHKLSGMVLLIQYFDHIHPPPPYVGWCWILIALTCLVKNRGELAPPLVVWRLEREKIKITYQSPDTKLRNRSKTEPEQKTTR